MAPTLAAGDRLLLLKSCRSYTVGDIVAFTASGRDYIKRIVGVPGQQVEWHDIPLRLDANEYFACGDNEAVSIDSRTFGPIPHRHIFGRVLVRYFPTLTYFRSPDR